MLTLASPDLQFNTVCLSKGHRSITAATDEVVITVVQHFKCSLLFPCRLTKDLKRATNVSKYLWSSFSKVVVDLTCNYTHA